MKVAGSIADGAIGIFQLVGLMAALKPLGCTQYLTEMNTMSFPEVQDDLTTSQVLCRFSEIVCAVTFLSPLGYLRPV